MIFNPEYRRNIWLEITPTRLAGMPFVLCAAFFMAWLSDDHSFGSAVRGTAITLFIALTFLWGTRQTSESIAGEIRERTWDWQRMSAIAPWTLTWGKLLGSTIYTWYGGAICLLFISSSNTGHPPITTLKSMTALVLGALLMQSFGFVGSLLMLARERTSLRSSSSIMLLLAFFMASPMFSLFSAGGNVQWFGAEYFVIDFLICSLAVFLLWMLTGAFNLIRAEFRMGRLPYSWCGFMMFMMFYLAGFAGTINGSEGIAPHLLVGYGTAASLTYLAAFMERKDPIAIAGLLQWWREGAWNKLLENLPCWMLSIPFVLLVTALQLVTPVVMLQKAGVLASRGVILAGTFFLFRDLALLLFLNFGKKNQRADMFLILCLSVLYGLIPGILNIMGNSLLTAVFWPRPDYWYVSLISASVEAAIISYLAYSRWETLKQPKGLPKKQAGPVLQ